MAPAAEVDWHGFYKEVKALSATELDQLEDFLAKLLGHQVLWDPLGDCEVSPIDTEIKRPAKLTARGVGFGFRVRGSGFGFGIASKKNFLEGRQKPIALPESEALKRR
ncbi:unnamed protein product [Symbiodinium sp. CCMP2592]|nr:unnamed protein product [Symbiodinium sp. CCMP2592]